MDIGSKILPAQVTPGAIIKSLAGTPKTEESSAPPKETFASSQGQIQTEPAKKPTFMHKLGKFVRSTTGLVATAAGLAVGAAVALATPAGPAIAAAVAAGGATALEGAGIGLAVAGIPTLGIMGLPGAVVGGLIGIAVAAGGAAAMAAAGGLAAIVVGTYAAGYATAYLMDKGSEKVGADKEGPIYGLKKSLPKAAELHSADTIDHPSIDVSMPSFMVEDWLAKQGISKNDKGVYEKDGLEIVLRSTEKPRWSNSAEWSKVWVREDQQK